MKKIITFLVLLMSAFILVGCNQKADTEDNKLNIITSFYPMYIATCNITEGVDNIELTCLASPSVGCLHDYQLTVNDMIKLERADIFVINGGGMESFLDKAISNCPDLKIVNASEGILEEHEEVHEHGEEHYHEENSHVWVSVSLYIKEVKNISEKLKEYDPNNAEKYEANTNLYIAKLEKLKKDMHANLDTLENKNIVTFHEAFEFFAEEFGLDVVAVIEREPGTSPNAKDVAEIIDTVRKVDVNAIFVEPQYLKTAANTIALETGVPVYELDPIVSGSLEKDAYIEIMEKNLGVLMEALK